MSINAAVGTPAFFTGGGYGSFFYVQLFSENRIKNAGTLVYPELTKGYVLDNQWPYNGYETANSTDTFRVPLYYSDSPETSLTYFNGVNINDGFKTFLMYLPPGTDVQPVAIHRVEWTWNVAATEQAGSASLWNPNPPGNCTINFNGWATDFPSWQYSYVN